MIELIYFLMGALIGIGLTYAFLSDKYERRREKILVKAFVWRLRYRHAAWHLNRLCYGSLLDMNNDPHYKAWVTQERKKDELTNMALNLIELNEESK